MGSIPTKLLYAFSAIQAADEVPHFVQGVEGPENLCEGQMLKIDLKLLRRIYDNCALKVMISKILLRDKP